MRLPRMTTRRLMIAVAVVAFGITCERLSRVVEWRHRRAVEFSLRENRSRSDRQRVEALMGALIEQANTSTGKSSARIPLKSVLGKLYELKGDLQFYDREAEYFARLRAKYERAAWQPWESIPPDPPPPN